MQRRYRGDVGEIRGRSRSSARPNLTPKTKREDGLLSTLIPYRRTPSILYAAASGNVPRCIYLLGKLNQKGTCWFNGFELTHTAARRARVCLRPSHRTVAYTDKFTVIK